MRYNKKISFFLAFCSVFTFIIFNGNTNVYAKTSKQNAVYVNAELNKQISEYSVQYTELTNQIQQNQQLLYKAINDNSTVGQQVKKSYDAAGIYARDLYKGDGQMSSGFMSMYTKVNNQNSFKNSHGLETRENLLSEYSDFLNLTTNIEGNIKFLKNLKINTGNTVVNYQTELSSLRDNIQEASNQLNGAKKLYEKEAISYHEEQEQSSSSSSSSNSKSSDDDYSPSSDAPPPINNGELYKVLRFAHDHLGYPYTLDGKGGGFNCSSFVVAAYEQIGVHLPGSPIKQYHATQRISESQLQPGDLIFYYTPISHVAIYYGVVNNKKVAIQALNPRAGVTILPISIKGMEAVAYGRVER